ncbi:MAG: hypothetical protein K0R00_122 [Herbinix sp.]|jgi:hypothetical protein|nr:hypothetical protein [Herbinix sp.]
MQNEQHTFDFDHLSSVIEERLSKFKNSEENFFICDRLHDNSSFLCIYKDSMFHYTDGVLLSERVYLEKAVKYEDQEIIKYTNENKALYDEFLHFTEEASKNENIAQEEVAQKLKEYTDRFETESLPKEKIKLPYIQLQDSGKKILLTKINDISGEALQAMSKVMAEHIISFYRTMFFATENDYGVMLRSVESNDFIDIVAVIIKEES